MQDPLNLTYDTFHDGMNRTGEKQLLVEQASQYFRSHVCIRRSVISWLKFVMRLTTQGHCLCTEANRNFAKPAASR